MNRITNINNLGKHGRYWITRVLLKRVFHGYDTNIKRNDTLLIIGAGGHGKVAADCAAKMKRWKTIAFLDDRKEIESCIGYKVIGTSAEISAYLTAADYFVAIGDNSLRKKIQSKLEEEGAAVATLLHPDSVIGAEVVVGRGSIVMAGVVINSSTHIGKGCIINTGSSLDHDNVIGDYVHISPGSHLAGNVHIEDEVWIGTGCALIQNVTVCSGCRVGAGAVVIKDITQPGTYVGVPVKKLETSSQ